MSMSEAAKEARREYMRQWRTKNRDRVREYNRRYRKNNREKYREAQLRYWERKASQEA